MADHTQIRAKIKANTNDLQRGLDQSAKGFSRLSIGKTIAVASSLAVAAFTITAGATIKLAKAYREQEKSENKVRAVIAATGGAAGVTAQSALKLAKGLQRFTTFSDELILDAQAVILTFKKIKGEVFERATALTLDLAKVLIRASCEAVN